MRKLIFTNGEFYHIYNRGVDKRRCFLRRGHYLRFLKTMTNILTKGSATQGRKIIKDTPLTQKISLICYCLMPNHYHFLIRQDKSGGVTEFMHKLNTSYTKYFNIDSYRSGRLFEYTFKAIHIETEEQLLHLSRYIHLNPLVSGITKDLTTYPWSSYPDYIGIRDNKLCNKEEILNLIAQKEQHKKYEEFVTDQVDYAKTLERIKKLTLE